MECPALTQSIAEATGRPCASRHTVCVPCNRALNACYDRILRALYTARTVAVVAQVWFEMSGAAAKAQRFPSDFYARLADSTPPPQVNPRSVSHVVTIFCINCCDAGLGGQVVEDIRKDLDRTYPGHTFFEHASNVKALKRLLTAFAIRNPEIGYCQSINFVAGMLLLHMSEEEAFWVLDVLVNEILSPSYYWYTLLIQTCCCCQCACMESKYQQSWLIVSEVLTGACHCSHLLLNLKLLCNTLAWCSSIMFALQRLVERLARGPESAGSPAVSLRATSLPRLEAGKGDAFNVVLVDRVLHWCVLWWLCAD